ncbi:MAG TPA: hypothetical protein VG942_03910 [Hyphomonadaceae bacterium]|nr:hypothetical protein [Hyphomonadaceae bacterium]
MIRAAFLALALAPLSACGFTPVYGPQTSLANAGPVSILEIQGRTGHFLREELIKTVGQGIPGVKGSTELEVKLSQSIERLAFAPDQAASRSDYVGTATWTLRGVDGKTLMAGVANERASFNFANEAYADVAAQSAAQDRLGALLARTIRSQMMIKAGKPYDGSQPATVTPSAPPLPGSTQATLPPATQGP